MARDHPHTEFVAFVQRLRTAKGLTDRQLALLIGISESQWSFIRRRHRRPGIKFITGTFRAFPEHQSELTRALVGEVVLPETAAVPALELARSA